MRRGEPERTEKNYPQISQIAADVIILVYFLCNRSHLWMPLLGFFSALFALGSLRPSFGPERPEVSRPPVRPAGLSVALAAQSAVRGPGQEPRVV